MRIVLRELTTTAGSFSAALTLTIAGAATAATTLTRDVVAAPTSCFLLYDEQDGRTIREPSAACSTRFTPASTFKIPHALAALDAGVVSPGDILRYDGSTQPFERWRADHDLASAMRASVVWYFQRLAERMGAERERAYLQAFRYGNEDASGPLTAFWLGTSLQISPLEQLDFLQRFFRGKLPVRKEVMRTVLATIEQPTGRIVNASGEHVMAAPWPSGTTIHAKTGRGIDSGQPVAWLVGRITRGARAWIFVSCVSGDDERLAAIKLAAARLRQLQVL